MPLDEDEIECRTMTVLVAIENGRFSCLSEIVSAEMRRPVVPSRYPTTGLGCGTSLPQAELMIQAAKFGFGSW